MLYLKIACKMKRVNYVQQYALLGPQLTVRFRKDIDDEHSWFGKGVEEVPLQGRYLAQSANSK
jgi:hypothetical protein